MNIPSPGPSKEGTSPVTAPPAETDSEAPDPSDAVLVDRSRAGDTEAFDQLVTRYRGRVYAMIMNMVRNDADAWDLAQDVFVKAWRALPRFEARASFFTWLYRITYNVTCDWIRRRRLESSGEFDDAAALEAAVPGAPTLPSQAAGPDERLESAEVLERIHGAMAELSEPHRAVVLMREVDGMKYEEIAAALGCSVGTVMSRLFYARRRLQGLLADVYRRDI